MIMAQSEVVLEPAVRAPNWSARHRRLVLLGVVLAGLVVYLPSLRSEFLLDDYLQASMIEGSFPAHRGPFDLYDFIDPSERPLLLERGMLPWWSHPQLRIRFLRPLPSVLRWTEQRLFGRGPLLPHAHSFLWWVAAVLAAHRLFWRVLSPRAALMATAIFAVAPCHALPLAWLANREALVSLVFGTLAVTAYLRWREEGGARHAAAAVALFALAMTGGEYALCMGGYVLASELSPRPGGRAAGAGKDLARRALGLALYAVPAAAYLGARLALGYGTRGSSFYSDPLSDPVAYLHGAPRRWAALVVQELLTQDADDAASVTWLWTLVLAGAALLVVPVRRTFAALDAPARARVKTLLLGSQLALVPVLAVDASPRVLGASLLGLAPTLALVLDHAWFPAAPPPRRGAPELTGLVALGIGFFQLVHGPATAFAIARHYSQTAADFVTEVADLHDRIEHPDDAQLMILRGGPSSFFVPFALARYGSLPARWRVLSMTGHVLGLRRDARTIELIAPKGHSMFSWFSWDLFRDTSRDIRRGQVFVTPGLAATVVDVGADGPRSVTFQLDRDLDAPDNVWVTESAKGGFPSATLPTEGHGQPYDP
jgi:hypothetical protein